MTAAIHPQIDQMEFFERYVNDVHPKPANHYDPLVVRLPQKRPINRFIKKGRQFEVECVFVPANWSDGLRWVYSDCRVVEYIDHPLNRSAGVASK